MDSNSVLLITDKVLPDDKHPSRSHEYTAGQRLAMLAMLKAWSGARDSGASC